MPKSLEWKQARMFVGRPSPYARNRGRAREQMDIATVMDLYPVICRAVNMGARIQVGFTSDGGALGITVWLGDLESKAYPSTYDELDTAITELSVMLTE